jgi:enoyl-CoA hydratase/carnithine racemase
MNTSIENFAMSLTCITQPHAHLIATLDESGVLELVLNRPERKNALFGEFYIAVEQALIEADQDPSVRVVLLRGEQDFSAGNDLQDFAAALKSDTPTVEGPPFRVLRAAASFSKPLVVAVRGVAIGIGTTILLHADLVYCDSTAKFQMPFLSLGLTPEGASTLLLPQRAGYLKAAELILLAEIFSPQTAVAAGLVNQIVTDDVYAHARAKALKLTQFPAVSVKATKAMLRDETPTTVIGRINSEAHTFGERVKSPAMVEALTAFKEKRAPNFRQFD